MSTSVLEFIYLSFKPDVRVEDPKSDAGRAFNDLHYAVKQHSGYVKSTWGRTVENENNMVWVVEWQDPTNNVPIASLEPFLAPETAPVSFHVTIAPYISNETFASLPVTELAVFAFPDNLSADEKGTLDSDLINFRSTLLNLKQQDNAKPPESFSMGWVERPHKMQHLESPSGYASLLVIAAGWESKEVHEAVRKTEEFSKSIAPVRERMLPSVKPLEMRHVRFQGH